MRVSVYFTGWTLYEVETRIHSSPIFVAAPPRIAYGALMQRTTPRLWRLYAAVRAKRMLTRTWEQIDEQVGFDDRTLYTYFQCYTAANRGSLMVSQKCEVFDLFRSSADIHEYEGFETYTTLRYREVHYSLLRQGNTPPCGAIHHIHRLIRVDHVIRPTLTGGCCQPRTVVMSLI